MRWFRDASIQTKLMILLMGLTVLALVLQRLVIGIMEVRTFRTSLVQHHSALADVVGANSAVALNFDDPDTARGVLSSLRFEPAVAFAGVYGRDGKVFAAYAADADQPVAPPIPPDEHFFAEGHLHLSRRITQDNEAIGIVYLRVSAAEYHAQLKQYLFLSVLVLLGLLGAATLLASWLQRLISRPIRRLALAMQSVVSEPKVAVRVKKESSDELGILCEQFNQMLQHIQERELALQQSEEQFREFFELSAVGAAQVDPAGGRFLRVNAKYCAITGYSADELAHMSFPQVTHPDERDADFAHSQRVLRGELPYYDVEKRYVRKDGQLIWVHVTGAVVRDAEGRPVRTVAVIQDVTERKRAEQALQESEARFHAFMDNSPVLAFLLDDELRLLYANQPYLRKFKVSREALGKKAEFIPAKFLGQYLQNFQAAVAKGETIEAIETYPRDDGTLGYGLVYKFPLRDASGRQLLGGVGIDITERTRAEETLRESEAHKRAVLETCPDAVVSIDHVGMVVDWNPAAEAMFGRARAEVLGKELADLIIPASLRESHRNGLARYRATGEGPVLGRLLEMPALRADGSEFPVELAITRVPVAGPATFTGFARDITERKRAEKAIAFRADLGLALAQPHPVRSVLQQCADSVVRTFDAAFARIWTLNEAEKVLELQASAGMYTHIDGGHARVPVGQFKIGLIAQEKQPHLTNAVMGDPRVHNQEWAKREGMVAFAGYPLLVEGRVVGVLALFARQPLAETVLANLAGGADLIAQFLERRRAEEALRRSHERFELVARGSAAGIWDWNVVTNADYFSEQWCKLLGYEAHELEPVFESWASRLHPDERDWVFARVRRHLEERVPYDIEYRMRTKSGDYRWYRATGQALWDDAGRPTRMAGSVLDITERKQAEQEIRRLNAELEDRVRERTAQLEAANKELEAFSYSVSHDLRAPLRAVDGFGRMLLTKYEAQLPAEAARYLNVIRDNTRQMGQLIDDLLAFSRLSRQPLRKQPVHLAGLVRAVLAELRDEQQGRRVDITVGELPICQGDPALLKQVVMNLIGNALKYSRPRAPAVIEVGCLSTPPSQGEPREGGERVYYVKDNGVGFDMTYVDKIFGVFQRLHRAEEYEGTGVGLAIVQRIIHRHGGRVWAEAKVDGGATFFFTIPEEGGHEE